MKSVREEKKQVKSEDAKKEKKLKGDIGFDCHYCNGANHMESYCILRKRDKKKNRVKYEVYYEERLEEVRAKMKGMSLVAKGSCNKEGTYQIWSSGSDGEEMRNPTHGAMYANFEEESEEEEMVTGTCFVTTVADKSRLTSKECALLESF